MSSLLEFPAVAPVQEPISEAEFARAYHSGFAKTMHYLRSRGVAADIAEEMAQAAWARGWEYRAQLRDPAAISHWIISIAKNLLRVSYRSKKVVEELTDDSARIHPDTDSLLVNQLLRRLSVSDQQLLLATYAEGCSSTEIAPKLGISAISVRVRVSRLKSNLRHALSLDARRTPAAA